jgi:DNA-binding response OmpR family regulator
MEPNVLIVDDEPAFLELEQLYLGKSGLTTTPCESASEAIDELKGGDYDIVVSDYQMPDIDGIDFLKALRKSGYNVGFVLFTGQGREDVAIDALNEGANYYIQKGTDMRSQFTLLAKIIDEIWRAQTSLKALVESERMLSIVNDRLDLLGSITRHDIRNEVSLANGYIEIAETETDPARARECLSKAKTATSKVIAILEIARTYQINGTMNIKWASLNSTLENAIASVPMSEVTYTCNTYDWTILVDPMLEMVCANIFSNSVKHGRNLSKIDVSCREGADGLDLIIEDDGGGISPGKKNLIFNSLTPAGAPHGLTIARRILRAERITLDETGTYGKGARFVLHFPVGLYKHPHAWLRQLDENDPQSNARVLHTSVAMR